MVAQAVYAIDVPPDAGPVKVPPTGSRKLRAMADSGATKTLIGQLDILKNVRECRIWVKCANGETMLCKKIGDLIVSTGKNVIVLRDVLYVAGAPLLISVSQLTNELNLKVMFTKYSLEFYRSFTDVLAKNPLLRSTKRLTDKLWYVDLKEVRQYSNKHKPSPNPLLHGRTNESSYLCWINRIKPDVDPNILHRRYGHASLKYLQIRFPHLRHVKNFDFCDTCAAMERRRPYSKKYSIDRNKRLKFKIAPINLIYNFDNCDSQKFLEDPEPSVNPRDDRSEVVGRPETTEEKDEECVFKSVFENSDVLVYQYTIEPEQNGPDSSYFGRYFSSDTKYVKTESVRGYRYLFIVVDKDTRVTFCFLGAYKHEFTPIILSWLKTVKAATMKFPTFWKFDSGTEFLNKELVHELRKEGIQLLFTTKGAHNQNPITERKIGVIWEAVLKTLADSGVPMQFWCYCAQYIVTVLNHLPSRSIDYQIPLAKAKFKLLDVLFLVFGCEVWWRDEDAVSNQTWSRRGVFLGISQLKLGYEVLDIATGRIFQTRNLFSNELRRPFRDAMQPCRIQLDFGTWPAIIAEEKVSIPSSSFRNTAEERGPAENVPLHHSSDISGSVPLQPPPVATSQVLLSPLPVEQVPLSPEQKGEPAPDPIIPGITDLVSTPLYQNLPGPQNLPGEPDSVLTPPHQNFSGPHLPGEPESVLTPPHQNFPGEPDLVSIPPNQNFDSAPLPSPIPGQQAPGKQEQAVSPIDLDLDIFNTRYDEEDKDDQSDVEKYWQNYPTLNIQSELEAKHPVIKIPNNDVSKIIPPRQGLITPGGLDTPEDVSSNQHVSRNLKPRNPLVPHVHIKLKSRPKKEPTESSRRMFLDLNQEVPTPREITSGQDPVPANSEGEYPIEKILDRRWVNHGKGVDKYDYLVQWEGNFEDSWIPGANLKNAKRLLQAFNKTAPPIDLPPVRAQVPKKTKGVDSNKINKKVKFNLDRAEVKHSHNLRPRKVLNYVQLASEYTPKLSRILENPPSKTNKQTLVFTTNDVQVHNPKDLLRFAKVVRESTKFYNREKNDDVDHVTLSASSYTNDIETPRFRTETLGTHQLPNPEGVVAYSLNDGPEAKVKTRPTVNIRDLPTFEEDEFFSKNYEFSDDNPRVATKIPLAKPEYKVEYTPWKESSLEEILKDSETAIRTLLQLDVKNVEEILMIDPSTKVPKTRNQMLQGETKVEFLEAEERELMGIHKHGTFEKVYCRS